MNALITATSQFGPFNSITDLGDLWDCDGVHYPKAVIGAAAIGTYVAPPPTPPVSPVSITMRQARLALYNVGLLPTVNAAIAGMAGAAGDAARIEWEFSSEVLRNKALVASMASSLALSDAQLDALFIQAATL